MVRVLFLGTEGPVSLALVYPLTSTRRWSQEPCRQSLFRTLYLVYLKVLGRKQAACL